MATAISVSLSDDVLKALNEEMEGYGDNRSKRVEEALRNDLGLQQLDQ